MNVNLDIRIEAVAMGYAHVNLIDNVSLTLDKGQIICVFGRNGCGKTTFIRSLSGLIPLQKGRIRLGGTSIEGMSPKEMAKKIAVVFANRPAIANIKVADFVSYGRYPYTNWLGLSNETDKERIERSIADCGIGHLKDQSIATLSDGEMQKVQIARALAQDTPILLLDEPISHLDIANKAEIYNLLKTINRKEGKTIVFTSHDLQFSLQIADQFIVIDRGGAEAMSTETFLVNKVYEKVMNSEFLDFDPETKTLKYRST